MRTNIFKDRIIIQEKVSTQTATGPTVTWKPVQTRYGRVVPVSADTRIRYQQLNSNVTDRIEMESGVTLELGTHRFIAKGHTYYPEQPPFHVDKNTMMLVREEN